MYINGQLLVAARTIHAKTTSSYSAPIIFPKMWIDGESLIVIDQPQQKIFTMVQHSRRCFVICATTAYDGESIFNLAGTAGTPLRHYFFQFSEVASVACCLFMQYSKEGLLPSVAGTQHSSSHNHKRRWMIFKE